MDWRLLNLMMILVVGLTACGSDPEPVNMDRRFLAGDFLEQERDKVRLGINGEVLDELEWVYKDLKVLTILSKERDPETNYSGIYLRQYDLSGQTAKLLWTYQDSLSCADAGAIMVSNQSPDLRPVLITTETTEQFVLSYKLGCSPHPAEKNLVVINAASGTPDVRLLGDEENIQEANGLQGLPEDIISMLLAAWEK